jgi:3-dehydroquinate synthetase
MRLDKKARAGTLRFALPRTIGAMAAASSGIEVDAATVREILEEG